MARPLDAPSDRPGTRPRSCRNRGGSDRATQWWRAASWEPCRRGCRSPDFRDEVRADPPGEWCHDAREFEVELGIVDRRLRGVDRGSGAPLIGSALIDVLRRAEIRPLQLLGAPELRFGECLLGLRGLELRDSLVELETKRPRVDNEEWIALVHDLP